MGDAIQGCRPNTLLQVCLMYCLLLPTQPQAQCILWHLDTTTMRSGHLSTVLAPMQYLECLKRSASSFLVRRVCWIIAEGPVSLFIIGGHVMQSRGWQEGAAVVFEGVSGFRSNVPPGIASILSCDIVLY